jgi:uncharacterized protein YbjT (DUF2867 family)
MKIVVYGDDELIGFKLVSALHEQGHDAILGSQDDLEGASVVIDASIPSPFERASGLELLGMPTADLLAAERAAGVTHHVALSVVGADRLAEGEYFRAKLAQERLVRASPIPYSIVRATQFFESMTRIAAPATDGDEIRLPPVFMQPIALDDVATAVARIAVGPAVNGIVEIAGPGPFRLDELVRRVLKEGNDSRDLITDTRGRYFGATVHQRTLLPGADVLVGETRIQDRFAQLAVANGSPTGADVANGWVTVSGA